MAAVLAQPPGTGARLDDLLTSRFLPRRWSARLWSPAELPARLERCAKNLAPHCEWRAYGEEGSIFFAIARPHVSPAQAGSAALAGQPERSTALAVYFLDANASVYSAGVWEYDRSHGWWLDSVLDVSYDCEHGWWLDGLMNPGGKEAPLAAVLPPREVRMLSAPASHPAGAAVRARAAPAPVQKRAARPRRVVP